MTVVFADLTESVRRTAALSPEQATDLVNPLLEAMVELMVRHGGRIDRFLGDGVLAVFGVPVAHEDDPVRAVRAAVDLRERALSLGVAVTVGVNTGRVYFGPVGSAVHEELTVMGPVVNLAARLQGAAGSGEILVGASTQTHVRAAFHLSPMTLDIKGLDEEVMAYRAESLVDHPDKVRGIEGLNADLVGRDTELGLLLDAVSDPNSPPHALVAPAGLGKSRLLAELNKEVVRRDHLWLEGRCLELTSHVPYSPFLDMLRRIGSPLEPTHALRKSLEELVAAGSITGERAGEIAPFLNGLFETNGVVPAEVAAASPDQRRALTVDALASFLTAQVSERPTVVVIEDLHWSDDSSIEVLQRLQEQVRAFAVTFVVTYRPDGDASSPQQHFEQSLEVNVVPLRELTAVESSSLIARLLDGQLPTEMERTIAANAGGNPFYVEEIIRTLIQRGVIEQADGAWQAVAAVDEVPVPESVEGVIMSRFDRLPVEVKAAARLASVWDDAFTTADFSAMTGAEPAARVLELIEAGLTRLEREGDDRRYMFVHALTRQAIYGSLLPSHRAELHERAGDILSARTPPEVGRIAYHYQRSRNHPMAVEWLYEAARRATDSYANEVAFDALERGMEHIALLPDEDQPRWRGRYRALRGELLERSAQYESARDELTAALDELDDGPIELSKVSTLIGQTHRLQGSLEGAETGYARAEEAIADLVDSDDPGGLRTWIDIQAERARALYFSGRGDELSKHLELVGPIVEANGNPAQVYDHLRSQLLEAFSSKRFVLDSDCVDEAQRARDLAASGLDPGRVAESLFALGFTLLWADRAEEAAATLEQAVTRAVRVGDVIHECRARAYHGVALRRAGRVDEAESAAHQALDLAIEIDNSYYQGHAHAVMSWVELMRGSGRCVETGEQAYRAWGSHTADGSTGLGVEFAWLAVFPLAAETFARGEIETAARHLANVLVPWERPLPADLRPLVERAVTSDTAALEEGLAVARRHRLL